METITKYNNRKLYSRTKKGYINLDELFEMVKQGQQVRVLTHKDMIDVTRPVLEEAVLRNANLSTEQLIAIARG